MAKEIYKKIKNRTPIRVFNEKGNQLYVNINDLLKWLKEIKKNK